MKVLNKPTISTKILSSIGVLFFLIGTYLELLLSL